MIVPTLIIAAVVLGAVGGMGVSWRLRKRRQGDLALPAAPADAGTPRIAVDGLYLATTFAGRPLERVAAAGLGFRAQSTITVTDRAVVLDRDGAERVVLPASALDGAGVATWTIDRAVEPGGLTVLAWSLDRDGERVPVESAFRLPLEPRADLIAAVRDLMRPGGGAERSDADGAIAPDSIRPRTDPVRPEETDAS